MSTKLKDCKKFNELHKEFKQHINGVGYALFLRMLFALGFSVSQVIQMITDEEE